ncbi:MAG: DUF554 domain-containing protein [Clostridiales bacterium]|nr:DUF554 domain-containing protein [Clostridiales bacterium]
MLGVVVNAVAIVAGALVGTIFKKGIPEKITEVLMQALGLCVIYIGIDGALAGTNALVLILSMVIGTIIGSLIDLDRRFENGAEKIGDKFRKPGKENKFTEGFVTATLLFCVGAMAVVGSIEAGLTGDNDTLYTKAMLDGISAIAFSSALGFSVAASAIPVLVYQGGIALLAQVLEPLASNEYMIAEMTCVGSILILVIGLNMLGLTKIKVMNMLPAVFMPFILCNFM